MYNLTNLTAANSTVDIATQINILSGGLMGVAILFLMYFMIFIGSKRFEDDTRTNFLVTATLGAFFAVIMFLMTWITQKVLIYAIVLFFVAAIAYFISE